MEEETDVQLLKLFIDKLEVLYGDDLTFNLMKKDFKSRKELFIVVGLKSGKNIL
jgi:hypothetical protein